MCAPGSACGCGSTASDLGGGVVMLVVGAVAGRGIWRPGGIVAFLAAHLVLLALAAVALPVATLAAVRYLRRYMVLVHMQPPLRVRQAAVATPALARPRTALAGSGAALAGSRPALARPRAALVQPRPALAAPAAAQLTMGGYHLHFHGVSAAEVAALLRHDGEPAALRRADLALLDQPWRLFPGQPAVVSTTLLGRASLAFMCSSCSSGKARAISPDSVPGSSRFRTPAQSPACQCPAAYGAVLATGTRITGSQAGCVIRCRGGRVVAVRSPRNEAGERLSR